jgi:hypothetical protein
MTRLLIAFVCACLPAATAFAQTAVLSAHTGTVDESSMSIVNFGSTGAAGLRASAPVGSEALIRYLIPNSAAPASTNPCLEIAYRDTGGDARVRVVVRELDFFGANRVVGAFDSNDGDAPQGAEFHLVTLCFVPRPGGAPFFNFAEHAYVIEVSLRRLLAGGQPGVQLMRIASQ